MAEEGVGVGPFGNFDRRILLAVVVAIVLTFILIFFVARGCRFEFRKAPYSVIYTNLELPEASKIITVLKDLNIPYEIREEGRSIAVPKARADEARLGLAEQGLPKGGTVGWEIFDQAKLGATDFDRRIQFIRALSGELGRTIRGLAAIEDARVQIVIPETRLFETQKAPVTASVLIKRRPGRSVTLSQVNGIVHLVASSVENLKPENVTVVDIEGHILAPRTAATMTLPPVTPESALPRSVEEKLVMETALPSTREVPAAISPPSSPTSMAVTSPTPTIPSAAEMLLQGKRELDAKLTRRGELVLQSLYPAGMAAVRVSTEIEPDLRRSGEWKIRKLLAVILVDQSFLVTPHLKKETFRAVAGEVGFRAARGDRMELWMVPNLSASIGQAPPPRGLSTPFLISLILVICVGGGILLYGRLRGQPEAVELPRAVPAREEAGVLDRVRRMAEENPAQFARVIERWLMEE